MHYNRKCYKIYFHSLHIWGTWEKLSFGETCWYFECSNNYDSLMATDCSCYYIQKYLKIIYYFPLSNMWFGHIFWLHNVSLMAKCIKRNVVCWTLWCHFNAWRQWFEDIFYHEVPHIRFITVILVAFKVKNPYTGYVTYTVKRASAASLFTMWNHLIKIISKLIGNIWILWSFHFWIIENLHCPYWE